MKKFLSLFFAIFLWNNTAHSVDWSWSIGSISFADSSYPLTVTVYNDQSTTIKVKTISIKNSSGNVLRTYNLNRTIGPNEEIEIIKRLPFSAGSKLEDEGKKASLDIDYNWAKTQSDRQKKFDDLRKKNKKEKSWFKWWYIPIALVIIGIISEGLKSSNNSGGTKTNEKMKRITRKASSPLAEGENFIFDVFEGKKPLVQTFWFVFIILNFIISFISGLAAEGLDNNFFLIGAVVSNVWAGIGTWNSATNYQLEKIKKQEPYGWSYAAKILVVLNFISFAGQAILLING